MEYDVFLWDRIVAMGAPWMTTEQSAKTKPAAFEDTMFSDGLNGIFRTTGNMPAGCRKDWGYHPLIDLYRDNEDKTSGYLYALAYFHTRDKGREILNYLPMAIGR